MLCLAEPDTVEYPKPFVVWPFMYWLKEKLAQAESLFNSEPNHCLFWTSLSVYNKVDRQGENEVLQNKLV